VPSALEILTLKFTLCVIVGKNEGNIGLSILRCFSSTSASAVDGLYRSAVVAVEQTETARLCRMSLRDEEDCRNSQSSSL